MYKSIFSRRITASLAGAAALFMLAAPSQAAPGDLDPGFTSIYPGVEIPEHSLAIQPDGKSLLASNGTIQRLQLDGTLDTSFSCAFSYSGGSTHIGVVVQGDKILIFGQISSVNGTSVSKIARLFSDGSLDTTFAPTFNAGVYDVMPQPDGKYVVAGGFTTVNSASATAIVKLNSDGTTDSTFSSPFTGTYVSLLARQSDGKILASGNLTLPSPYFSASRIVRLNTDGSVHAVGPVVTGGEVRALSIQPDGNILLGGSFTQIGSTVVNQLAQLDTTLAPTAFDANLTGRGVTSITLQSNGKILVGGSISDVDGNTVNNLTRLNADGTFDNTLTPAVGVPAYDSIHGMGLQTDGKIVVTGDFIAVNSTLMPQVARLENNAATMTLSANVGVTQLTWTLGGTAPVVQDVKFQASQNGGNNWTDLGAGTFTSGAWTITVPAQPSSVFRCVAASQNTGSSGLNEVTDEVAYNAYYPGQLDTGFDPNASLGVYASAQQADGKIVIGGIFTQVGGVSHPRLARVNLDGSLDSSFNPSVSSDVHAIVLQPDGKIVISGEFTQVNGVTRNRIARLNNDGTLDTSFTTSVSSQVLALALQLDGKILIGGDFTQVNSVTRNRIARLNSDGTLDTGFDPNASSHVRSIALQTDGKIVVGGVFTQMGGVSHARLARLNSDGTLDSSFNPTANDIVLAVFVQADGEIVIGGVFSSVSGSARANLARLNADGTLDSTGFLFGPNNDVYGITQQADGKTCIYGHFTSMNTISRGYVSRLNTGGFVDFTFSATASNYVYTGLLQADGELVLGGLFTAVGGTTRNRVARYRNDVPDQKLSRVGVSHVQWLRGGSLPEAVGVWFDVSTDGGSTWSNLGTGNRISGGWDLSGLTLPTSGKLRARAITRGGKLSSSSGICEVITDF